MALYNPAGPITPPFLTMALMLAIMLASSGVASATPGGEHGQGAAHTTLIPQAQFKIANAIAHNFSGGCTICG